MGIIFFGDAFLGNRTLVPTGRLAKVEPWKSEFQTDFPDDPEQQHDLLFQFYPWARYFRESVGEGRFPLWNPYNYLGTPFFGNPQTALLFPFTWLHLLLPLGLSFTLIFVAKLAAAIVGMFLWLNSRGLSSVGSLVGAVIYSFSMHTVVSLPFPYSTVTVLLPWALLCAVRLVESAKPLWWMTATLSISLIVLAGQPQSALPAFLAVGIHSVSIASGDWTLRVRRLLLLGTAFLSAGLITAVQWLASIEYVSESMVHEGPRIIHSGLPYSPSCFLNLLFPEFFGSHIRGDFWGFPGYHDIAFYSSSVGLLLALFAFSQLRGRDCRFMIATVGTGLLSVVVLLGVPGVESLLDLPGFELIRRNKMVFLLILSLAGMAGRGMDQVMGTRRTKVRWALFFLVMVFALSAWGLWEFRPFLQRLDIGQFSTWSVLRTAAVLLCSILAIRLLHGRRVGAALLFLTVIDLFPVSYTLNPRGEIDGLYPEPALLKRLEGNPARIYGMSNIFFPNSAAVFGLQDLRGYDVMTPRRVFRYMQQVDPGLGNVYEWLMRIDPASIGSDTLMRRSFGRALEVYGRPLEDYMKRDSYWSVGVGRIADNRLFRALQIEYLLRLEPQPTPGFQNDGRVFAVHIYRNPSAVRAKLFGSCYEASDESEALDLLSTIDLDRSAVVETSLDQAISSTTPLDPGEIEALGWEPERSAYRVRINDPRVLVVFERYSPGWEASIEGGEDLEVFPANILFRGVELPPGRHTIHFEYNPAGVRYGALLSVLGMLTVFGCAGLALARSKRSREKRGSRAR